jgi:DNA helicase II / ATP-dependent DNA helicase PcrA
MAWDDGLDGPHKEIAASIENPICVLAGPGTGKTFAMMRRVARLLEQGADPTRVLAVTFTRTAAIDLSEQLADLRVPGADRVKATTLHALCFSALSRDDAFDQTQRHARPLLSYEINALKADLANDFGGKRAVSSLISAYEAAWARLQRDLPGWAQTPDEQRFETALISWLRFHKSMLIGELVPMALGHLRSNPAVRLFGTYDHVLVDEFQDLNRSDQALVKVLSAGGTLTVMGDDNQSIYSFRHANPQGIRDFPSEDPDTVVFEIAQCRRCPSNIVAMSNALIAHDPYGMRSVPLVADPARRLATVYAVQHQTQDEEIETVSRFIASYLAANPDTLPGQVLVLSPRRFIGQGVMRALNQLGLNSLSYFYEDELDSDSSAEGFCLLTLSVRPEDRAALRGWFSIGASDSRVRPYGRLMQYCSANSIEPHTALDRMQQGALSIPYVGSLLPRHRELLRRRGLIDGLEGLALVDALWSPTNPEVQDLRRLAQALVLEAPARSDLLELLHQEITQPELPGADDDIIRVMSLHKSKGLTAKLVVVVGCIAGALPTIKDGLDPAAQDSCLAEQRRLFYVAITRATDTLVLSGAATMTLKDAMRAGIRHAGFVRGQPGSVHMRATPFIGEMGATVPSMLTTAGWRGAAGF